jgi:uncharacterized membrane protein (DUF441 family)
LLFQDSVNFREEQKLISQSLVFLLLLLSIAIIAKNKSLLVAVTVLIVLKLLGVETKVFSLIHSKGIEWGVTIITIAVLVPIAIGDIGFKDLGESFKSPLAWIALISGIGVALLAKGGLILLAENPQITTALVLGTILAVTLFNGVAVGPLIGAGIAYAALRLIEYIK